MNTRVPRPAEPTWADVWRQLKILARLRFARFLLWLARVLKL